ncbi:MAG: formylglycine-generating enzyme family protein [Treponema sp.]|jgi:formylglycine-generating enzyme required for sulfatase activity|nr:formylglycine-generating enzyme family protein [Treponema sp.]
MNKFCAIIVVTLSAGLSCVSNPAQNTPPDAGFVRINGGTFTIGSPGWEGGRENDEVQRSVTVGDFYMGRYEVTQREWVEVMGSNPSRFKGNNRPVERVNWFEVIDYCIRRSEREGLTPAYTRSGDTVTWNRDADGYRLPTEAEWEYACRAGTGTEYSTGPEIATGQANYGGFTGTRNVGSYEANNWGLYDMHGNVWEWCWDWYADYSDSARFAPTMESPGYYRVIRGGGWYFLAMTLRSASRDFFTPNFRHDDLGFRLVRSGL